MIIYPERDICNIERGWLKEIGALLVIVTQAGK
jgi:hypothetical protein